MIIPAVIPKSFEEFERILRLVAPFASALQLDVVDGVFVENVAWPYGADAMSGSPSAIAPLATLVDIEIDMMIQDQLSELPRWFEAGAERAVLHIESGVDVAEAHRIAQSYNALLGVSSNNDTSLELFLDALGSADYAQCMGIAHIGVQGQPFDEQVLARIHAVRERYPDMEIAVDGGVNLSTAHQLASAGATRLIAGSAILGAPHPAEAYHALLALTERGA